jgi:hypothetical protein
MEASDHSSAMPEESLAKNAALHFLGIIGRLPKNTLPQQNLPPDATVKPAMHLCNIQLSA